MDARVQPIRWDGARLWLLDQRSLPREVAWVPCDTAADVARAIRAMVVRGAPAIGIAAAYGLVLDARRGADRVDAARVLADSRPTAVNLRWALDRLAGVPDDGLADAAIALHAEDVAINRAIGAHGAAHLPEDAVVWHHCNTGALATGGWGTALGIVRTAHAQGRLAHVVVGETRPYLQGARLTAWELREERIPYTLVVDSAAGALLPRCDAVLVGCDRVAANGDVANKIGTLGLAILARYHGIPLIVAMPRSTLDLACPTGADIPIEQRDAAEVRGHGGLVWSPEDAPVDNPAFDVTPAALVSAWITEDGPWCPADAG